MMRRLLCRPGATLDGDLMDYLIAEIQSGAIDLTPTEASGWYDHQLYALETLLLPDRAPESEHLLLTREYKEKLVDTFRSIVTQNRETHVRQLELPDIGPSVDEEVEPVEFDIYPKLVVEPFPTFYLRTARAYRFVQGMLEAVLGSEFLSSTSRVLEDGDRHDPSLNDELYQIITLLYGLHLRAAESIGMAPGLSDEETAEYDLDSARERAEEWLAGWRADVDVNRDPRVIVPVAISEDPGSGQSVVSHWAVVGIRVVRVHASFPETHRPEVVQVPGDCIHRGWKNYEPYLLIEAFAEVTRRSSLPPLDRDEFRAICDQHDDLAGIVSALEAE